ncbi:MAG: glycosyltransferase family 4 protein, partial [Candidatus Eremiobacteraeota bacterium]|nr:glycosyltransferase family 4 protein [Candidatus Eremiobacteraeota bacterium]
FRLPTPEERQTARRFLGLENGRRALLFFGRDNHIKGADLFASALEQLPQGAAVICVASPREVVSMIAQHAKVISTGIVADPRPFYWAADALAMPSRHEGTPLTLLEARATGLPAIVSTIPAFEDVASKDEGVIVSDHLDPRAFARSLMEPLERRPISADARENISLDAWCQKVFAHYAMSPLGLSAIS